MHRKDIKMNPFSTFVKLAKELNSLADSGESLEISYTAQRLNEGQLFEWLAYTFNGRLSEDLLTSPSVEIVELYLKQLYNNTTPESLGVATNGINLLIAYCLKGIKDNCK